MPIPDKGEVLVKIRASGCCFTDFHAMRGDLEPYLNASFPCVTGHEGIGIVMQVY
jgi:D-arabinose 1-dehydrogenase-like Zn-dependent alcohol dehydrogenase